jgi:glycosyltransferase involved in cell wall biosynthesis
MSMRVLFVINGLGTGGAERSISEMTPFLREGGIDATIVCLYRRTEGVEAAMLARGEDVRFLASRHAPGRVRELRTLFGAVSPDLVHTTIWESNIVGRLAAAGRLPVLTSLVNTPYAELRRLDPNIRWSRLRVIRLVDGFTARRLTTHFHAITNAVKLAAVESLRISPERITVIERGRDPDRLGTPSSERRRRARSHLGLREDDRVVACVGRQEFQKGHHYLIQAIEMLPPEERPILLLAGRLGEATADVERAAAGLGAHVRFLGHRDDVPEILAAADAFAFPSLWEGLGGALIEAMALGLPIVASDVPAIREVVEEGGNAELVPPGDPAGLADGLRRILDDARLRASFGERSREIFLQRFTLERSAKAMVGLYERILAGRRSLASRSA